VETNTETQVFSVSAAPVTVTSANPITVSSVAVETRQEIVPVVETLESLITFSTTASIEEKSTTQVQVSTTLEIMESSVVGMMSTYATTDLLSTSTKKMELTLTETLVSTISTNNILTTEKVVTSSSIITEIATTVEQILSSQTEVTSDRSAFRSTTNVGPQFSLVQQTAGSEYQTPTEVVSSESEELQGNNNSFSISLGTIIPGLAGLGAAAVLYWRKKNSATQLFRNLLEEKENIGMINPLFNQQGFVENPLFEESSGQNALPRDDWHLL